MRLLLDTHAWLWTLRSPEKLAPRTRTILSSPNNELWLSSISVWEALLLAERGRLKQSRDLNVFIEKAVRTSLLREAPLTHAISLESRRILQSHPDPADRFLVATARLLKLTLVTADATLLNSDLCETLPAA